MCECEAIKRLNRGIPVLCEDLFLLQLLRVFFFSIKILKHNLIIHMFFHVRTATEKIFNEKKRRSYHFYMILVAAFSAE